MKKGIWNKYYSKESKLLILKVDKKVNKPIKSWKWEKEKESGMKHLSRSDWPAPALESHGADPRPVGE